MLYNVLFGWRRFNNRLFLPAYMFEFLVLADVEDVVEVTRLDLLEVLADKSIR